MYIRFAVENLQYVKRHTSAGLFVAVHELLEKGDISLTERQLIEEHISWLNEHLPVSEIDTKHKNAIHWFKDHSECSEKVWDLVQMLKQNDYQVELITTNFPGLRVYSDKWQIAAIPRKSSVFHHRAI